MRKFLLYFFFSLFLIGLSGNDSNATHVMGSDIVYRCLGNGRYEITVRVYRDCNGVQLSQSPVVARCGSNTININTQTKVSQRDITGIDSRCPIQSRCSGSYAYGVEEHIWRMTIDLSSYTNCCEWELSWQQCCRNSNISTGQADQNFYTTANLNRCITPCNNSPDFTNPPVAIICANQDFVFNNGALDTLDAGDSLSYELVAGLQNAGSQVSYSGQFSPVRPLTFFGFPNQNLSWPAGFRLDPLTGDLLFRPTSVNQVATLVIEVVEWRRVNGVMEVIGRTRRDMQIIVVNCPNNKIPRILPPYSRQACAGQQVCLSISTIDDDTNDTVRISWNRGIPGATFTNNNGSVKHASGEVCWTPEDRHVSNIPYTFTVTARDDACPLAGQGVRSFSIFVRETPKASRNIQVLRCGRVAVSYTPDKTYAGLTSSWVVRDSVSRGVWSSTAQTDTAFVQPGAHRVFLTLTTSTPCINLYIDSIIVPEFVRITTPTDTLLCDGTPITITPWTRSGVTPYEFQWFRLDSAGPTALTTQESITVNVDTNRRYVIRVKDGDGCFNWDTTDVLWNPVPLVNTGPDQRICSGTEIQVTNNVPPDTLMRTFRYLWSNGDTTDITTLRDSNSYWLRVTDSIGCSNYDTMMLRVNNPKPELGPNVNICDRDTVTLTATRADTYSWYDLSGFTINPLPTPVRTGATYTYTVTENKSWVVRGVQTFDGVTCFGFDTVTVNKWDLPAIEFDPGPPLCPDANSFALNSYLRPPTLTSGTWSSTAVPTAIDNNFFFPNRVTPNPEPGWPVTYRVVDNRGCRNSAGTFVKISPLPTVSVRDSIAVCADAGDLNLNTLRILPFTTFGVGIPDWYSVNNNAIVNSNIVKTDIHNPVLRIGNLPQGNTYFLAFRFTNSASGCTNYDTTYVRVKTVPNTDAGFLAPVCWNADPVNLNTSTGATPAGGTWSSANIPLINGNTAFNPRDIGPAGQFFPSLSQPRFKYSVTIEGCTKEDSVTGMIRGIPQINLTPLAGICSDSGAIDLTNRANWNGSGAEWSGPGVSGVMFDPIAAGSGTHLLNFKYVHPSTGCENQSNFSIEVQPKPVISFTTPEAACAGVPFDLNAQLTNTPGIMWTRVGDGSFETEGSGIATTQQNPTRYFPGGNDIASGTFRIMGETTNPRYCQPARIDQQVGIFPIPTAAISADPLEGCQPLPVDFEALTDAGQGVFINWDFGNGTVLSGRDNLRQITETYQNPGSFTVNMYLHSDSAFGYCRSEAIPVTITVFPTPDADFDANRWNTTVALPGIQFTDRSTIGGGGNINAWDWSFGDRNNSTSAVQNPYFEYPTTLTTDTGTFPVLLRVETPDGCWDTITKYVRLGPDITVFIPNAFTPNGFGDTMNDRFYVIADGFDQFSLTIFNRWGEEVYYSTDIKEGWDGKYKNEHAQQDVYMYLVRVRSLAGKEFKYYGTVTLLR